MAAAAAGDCSAAEVAAFCSALSPKALAGFYLVGDLQGARDAAARSLAQDLGAARCSALTSKVKQRVQQEYALWRTRHSRGARAVPDRPSSSEVGPQHLLDLWFGPQPDAWRNSLWFLGVDPDAPERGDGGLVEPLRTMYLPLIESCRCGLSGSPLEEWTGTIQGRVGLVVVLDQFPRLVVPGTPDMLMCAGLAQEVAKEVLSDQGEELPWAHKLFCYLALMHAEDLELASEGALNILRLTESFDSRDNYRGLSAHLRDTWLVAQEHLSLLRRFGRYPHYNLALGRESTEAEATWLRSKKLPFWAARSTFVGSSSQAGAKKQAEQKPLVLPSGVKHNRLRILVLHGMKMNGKSFEKKARNFFGPLRDLAELVFIDGPRPYVAAGETGAAGTGVRCWYDTTDDSGSIQYVGLGDTLGYMERVFAESGPFDGVLGFSQGGCFAAIMAALQKSTLKFRFCVIISAPYCRDSKRLELHLKEAPVDHIEGCVRARVEPLEMPSFHVWGSTDTQIEPWRSELLSRVFKDPVVHTHTAGHWAPSSWPAKELAVWLRDTIGLPSDDATVGASLEIDERLRSLSLTAKLVRGQGGVEVVVPSDIEQALEICRTDQELLLKLLNLVLGRLRSTPGTSFPEVAYIIVAALLGEVTDLEEHRRQLHQLQELWGWRAFTQLDAALQNSDAKPGVSGDLREALRSAIVDIFAQQLEQDAEAAASWMRVAPAEAQQSLTHLLAWRVDGMAQGLARPSECAREAPRFGGALYKATYLALRVASRMHEVRTGKALERPRDQQPELRKMYGAVLHDIITICDAFDEDKVALAKGEEKKEWRIMALSEVAFERLRAKPISEAVLEPLPEPVQVSSKEQMEPLYVFLHSGQPFSPNMNSDQVFERGTITQDKRLDLCKQVIGPSGIDDLFSALEDENKKGGLVKHLLLGNNVCGNGLPARVAEMIAGGSSKLTTWYIAGNRITGDALLPLCEVLKHDTQVLQLWLKRNPLKELGAVNMASMLKCNRTLQVLDVVNCGLLDAGAKALAAGLVGSSVRHLYANGNGLSAVGAEAIAAAGGSFLHTLSLGDNRLNDDGTVAVAKHCGGVVRLALAASGISDVGARALADLIRASRVLRWLDLGISKSTAALGEVPNRLGDLGAEFLAEALGGPGDVQAPLNALVLVHNSITAPGVRALQAAAQRSKTLVKLELDYLDARGQELAREEIRSALARNFRTLEAAGDAGELRARREALDPEHLEEIKSVYRVGNAYSPGGQ